MCVYVSVTSVSLPVESLSLIGQKVLDVGTASEDALQVDPASLHVNPHIKHSIDTVQPLLPLHGIVLKHLQEQEHDHWNEHQSPDTYKTRMHPNIQPTYTVSCTNVSQVWQSENCG